MLCCRRGFHGPYDILKPPLAYVRNPLQAWQSAMKFRQIAGRIQPDIIHITVEPYATIIPFLNRRIANKTILTIHGSYGIRPLEHYIQRAIALQYYKKISQFITVSHYTKKVVRRALKHRKNAAFAQSFDERTTVIHNGIVLPEDWKRYPKPRKRKNILLVGGVKPRKGILEALEACALYKKNGGSPFTFFLVGTVEEDAYLNSVQKKIHDYNLHEEVQILGATPQEKLENLYRSSDLYLMPAITVPNTFEGFGLVYLEANAYGTPCIGPHDSGAREAIVEGKSGYIVNPKDPQQIAERMHRVLDKGSIRREDCRKWAEEHEIGKTVNSIETVYSMVQSST